MCVHFIVFKLKNTPKLFLIGKEKSGKRRVPGIGEIPTPTWPSVLPASFPGS